MKINYILFLIVILGWLISACFYTKLPDDVAIRWNIRGEAIAYSSKNFLLLLFSSLNTILAILFFIIPKIDPLKHNIERFRKYYDNFVLIILLSFLVIFVWTILWNLGIKLSFNIVLSITLGSMIFYCGVLLENAKRNWFIGIRTPWTLSSDKVWNKTHKLGAKIFKAIGILFFFGILIDFVFLLSIILLLFSSVYLVIYSYLEYRKIEIRKTSGKSL